MEMYKNETMYVVELEGNPLKHVIEAFYQGAEIVYFTKEHKFVGGGTKGDIKRYFNGGNTDASLNGLINTQIRFITFSNEKQVFNEAEKIFGNNWMIKNIPVVDTAGKLLFQIDRYKQEDQVECIQEAIRNGSIDVFLNSDDISKIVLTGAEYCSLLQAKKLLEKYIEHTVQNENITLELVANVKECCYTNTKIKVVCLNDVGSIFINQHTEYQSGAISAKELVSFGDFSKLDKIDKKIIEAWKNIFEYETVVFCSSNCYISQLAQLINSCGINVQTLTSDKMLTGNLSIDFLSSLDVLLFSKDRTYCEKIQVAKLIQVYEWFWHYKQITGYSLTPKHYMTACNQYLNCLKQEGYEGLLCKVNNSWTEKLIQTIKETSDLEIISSRDDKIPGINYVVDFVCMKEASTGDYIRDIRDASLLFACENAVYNEICKICRNVYIFPAQDHVFDNFMTYTERERYNFIHHKEKFPKNFIKEICNDENYPLDQVVHDMKDCQTVKINDEYIKFLSNYQSKYFNTDTYGSRVVSDVPSDFSGTIWLAGGCNFTGYVVEDKDTTASYLQKKINEAGYPYRVVDLSCDAATSLTLYGKMLDRDIAANDIVVILEHTLIIKEKLVKINYKEMNKRLGKIWYWDRIGHPGFAGYQIFAENVFEAIKPVLNNEHKKNHTFYVNKDLEHKIYAFITELKGRLKENERYQKILYDLKINYGTGRKNKIGAIVMNCNPFTYGHQYLIETSSRLVDLLYVFVVEENKSVFPFEERLQMVQEGAVAFENVVVVPSGQFMISTITFPGYFLKDSPTRKCFDTFLDLKIFAHYIAPQFGIQMRFVGEEPTDKVTAQYNIDMKLILSDQGINVIEIPRKRSGKTVISASKVRKLLEEHNYAALEQYVPETTMKYLSKK